jgi:hypothetical protein
MHMVRTIGDGGDEAISRNGTVVDHSFGHGLLSHEIAKRGIRTCERMIGETYLSTRASDVSPAIAMPT